SVIVDLRKAKAQLEDYSKNLEQKVEQRTAELAEANALIAAVINSLKQGFFVFDANGNCLPFYSKACETLLYVKDINKPVWEILQLPPTDIPGFKDWIGVLFAEPLPFDDIAVLGPQ